MLGMRYATLRRSGRTPWQARATVKQWLAPKHPAREDALQVISELVTNAVEHVPGGAHREWLKLSIGFGTDFVRLQVIDPGNPEWRTTVIPRQAPPPDADHGRGLPLVAHLSVRCGTHITPEGHRVVWCDLANPVFSAPE